MDTGDAENEQLAHGDQEAPQQILENGTHHQTAQIQKEITGKTKRILQPRKPRTKREQMEDAQLVERILHDPSTSSELLTEEEERALLAELWSLKQELVTKMIRWIPKLRTVKPNGEPFPMASFIANYWTSEMASVSQLRALHTRYHQCRHRMSQANVRLAVHIAKRFLASGLDFDDLKQTGEAAVLVALDRFDVRHGTRFGTYATWWIRQMMQTAVARESTRFLTSLSPHIVAEQQEIRNFIGKFTLENGGIEPEIPEIAAALHMSIGHVTSLIYSASTKQLSNIITNATGDFDSLEGIVSTNGKTALNSRRDEDDANTTFNEVLEGDKQQSIDAAFQKFLRPREAKVLGLRFGLHGGHTHSLREIGHMLRISKERVRQIQNRALEKLRDCTRGALLDLLS